MCESPGNGLSYDDPVKTANNSSACWQTFRRKRSHGELEASAQQFRARWLVESTLCARILGSGGCRIKRMKELTGETGFDVWITPKVPGADYRVFSCVGKSINIAKIAGLFVRRVFDENEHEPSNLSSKRYDLKLLVPASTALKLAGPNRANFHQIEDKSNAALSLERDPLGASDELCLHVYGVADAIQIAAFYVLETLAKVMMAADLTYSKISWFEPVPNNRLSFSRGFASDEFAKRMHNMPSRPGPALASPPANSPLNSPSSSTTGFTTPEAGKAAVASAAAGQAASGPVPLLPGLASNVGVPAGLHTAYEIARDSQRKSLCQVIRLDAQLQGPEEQRQILVDNILRVTQCRVEVSSSDDIDTDDNLSKGVSFMIEGPPEDNMLAIFLIYRFVKMHIITS